MFETIWLLSKTLVTKQGLIVFGHQTFFLFGQSFIQLVFCILSAVEPQVIQIMRDLYQQSGNWEQAT